MGLLDRFFKKTKTNTDFQQIVHRQLVSAMKRVSGSRRQTTSLSASSLFWYESIISKGEFRSKNVMENLKMLRDMNPDASMALWNFLRLANNGHDLEAVGPNGKAEKISTDLINSLAERVGGLYGGGADQLINVLLLTGLTQGAIAMEVEINEDLTDIVDFHAVDPSRLDFRRNKDTGELELVQRQADGSYKVLNQEQVFYYPFDPDIDDPYGRSPILPVLQVVFFQMEVLRDLQKAVHHQGWERFDISVIEEAIMNNMPDEIKMSGQEEVYQYIQSYVDDVEDQMRNLEPDADFFHTDSVKIETAGGTMSKSLDATGVINVINQQIVTALKQLPILLGRNEGTTETHGTVQWQIYVAGIESIQRGVKRLMEKGYNVALDIYGRPRRANLTFHSVRVNDRLKEAQAEEAETRIKITQQLQGWIDNDEAAMEMVGHKAFSDPIIPFTVNLSMKPNQSAINANSGPPGTGADPNADNSTNTNAAKSPETRTKNVPEKKFYRSRTDSGADEFVSNIEESWASDIATKTSSAATDFRRFLKNQRDKYISRLPAPDEIPTRVLVEVRSLQSFLRADERPGPSHDFENYVRSYILYDSSNDMIDLMDLQMTLFEDAAALTGSATMLELELEMEFNATDESLLRSLSDRSRRDVELIQGVSDESVIMSLWDLVYDGKYSIDKAEKALREEYAFSKNRARTIARTEIISAGRTGQYYADIQSGIVIGKQWMSAHQERTREGHREADGQIVGLQEAFSVANKDGQYEMLLFPGDTSLGASASNIIQCRCWYKRILEGEEDKLKN